MPNRQQFLEEGWQLWCSENPKTRREALEMLANLHVRLCPAKRSNQANAYYWGVVLTLISQHTGDHIDELHYNLTKKLRPMPYMELDGTESVRGKSTREMSKKEFAEYVDEVIVFAAHFFNVVVPPPPAKQTQND